MSDATPSAISPEHRAKPRKSGLRLFARIVLFLCLIAAIGYVAFVAWQTVNDTQSVVVYQNQTVAHAGLTSTGHKALNAQFADTRGRLLADPPTGSDQLLNPDTLVVAHISGADETPGGSWQEWEAHLAQVTGKKVVDQIYTNSASQVAADSGKVTLLALHAADAPFLVNNYGFEPLAVLGDQSGINGNHLDIIVPADSSIAKPTDLKGHKLVCTVPSSITGYRAAAAYLMHDQGLRPYVDYEIIWSLSQKHSITGIAGKEYEAAAVSDDKLQSLLAKGTITASQFKVIYQSPVIPRTTIGYFYNLNPTLADQIRQAILTATPDATTSPATAPASDAGLLSFLPVDYRRDFQFVRDIDDQFDPRFDAQKTAKSHESE